MGDQQYDVTRAQKAILLQKAKRRAELREEFLKQTSNPLRHGSGEGGTVFDEGIHRFMASKVNFYDHFKANAKTARLGILAMVVPIVGYGYLLKTTRASKEEKIRTGQVAYQDRIFKYL